MTMKATMTILIALLSLFSTQAFAPAMHARQASALASSVATEPLTMGNREYFAQRVQESRNLAIARTKRPSAAATSTTSSSTPDNYFAQRIQEARARTLLVSMQAAAAARERTSRTQKKILFSPVRRTTSLSSSSSYYA